MSGRPLGRVVSIVGTGRSGTTILSSILGELPDVFSAGELRWLWGRDLVQQRVCGCGNPPAACPVWAPVVEKVLGVPAAEQSGERLATAVRDILAAQEWLGRLRNRNRVVSSPSSPGDQPPEMARITEVTVDLVEALMAQTGARTIVDASKRPLEAAVLAASRRFDHYVLHVVRDPRAVVHSWRRAKPLPSQTGRTAMSTRRPRTTVYRWNENALGAEMLRRHLPRERYLRVRYEDFAERPREAVDQVLGFLGVPAEAPFVTDDTVLLGTNHNLSGNPNRFKTGPVRIVPDAEWRQRMPQREQRAIAAATAPFLLRYGYPLRSGALQPPGSGS